MRLPRARAFKAKAVVPAQAGTHNTVANSYYVYMLASRRHGAIYTGVTGDLIKRIWQHKEGFVEGFAKEYATKHLVWYEQHDDVRSAITGEKTHQEMEPRVENRSDTREQSALAEFV